MSSLRISQQLQDLQQLLAERPPDEEAIGKAWQNIEDLFTPESVSDFKSFWSHCLDANLPQATLALCEISINRGESTRLAGGHVAAKSCAASLHVLAVVYRISRQCLADLKMSHLHARSQAFASLVAGKYQAVVLRWWLRHKHLVVDILRVINQLVPGFMSAVALLCAVAKDDTSF